MHIPTAFTGRKRVRTWQIVCTALLLLAACGVIALDMTGHTVHKQATIAPSPKPKQTYGIAVSDTLTTLSHKVRRATLQSIRSVGFTEVRLNLDWDQVQPHKSTNYNWKMADAVLNDVADAHLRAIVTLDRTPPWARSTACSTEVFCPPAHTRDFAAFAAAAAKRYHNQPIDAWEIWNEPNITNFWKPHPSSSAYAALLQAAHGAIKKQLPGATVLIGGLAGNALDSNGTGYIDPRTYLSDLYSQGVKNYFDGVGYHPYTGLRLPTVPSDYNGWLKMAATTPSLRSIMTEHHDQAKALWLTEFGMPTQGSRAGNITAQVQIKSANHVTMSDQATAAGETLKLVRQTPWIRNFDWYTYSDNKADPYSSGGSFGIIAADNQPKPAYYTFKEFLR